VWAADITYVQVGSSWLYMAVVMDLFSRKVVGWAAEPHLRTDLCLGALKKALAVRQPPAGLIHHSDRGCQYTSQLYRDLLEKHGLVASMSRKGDCWDNAVVESFFGTLKTELVHRQALRSLGEAREAIGEYIHRFYNLNRRHSALGGLSPVQFEQLARRSHFEAAA
jgi:putative transposase